MDDNDRACFGHSLELREDGRNVLWDGNRPGLRYMLTPTADSSVTVACAGIST